MSGHYFFTTHNAQRVKVTIGFSRAARGPGALMDFTTPDYVFMTVIPVDDEGFEDDEILYNNLDDPVAGTKCTDVNYFRRILERLGIAVPESMFRETVRDQAARQARSEEHFSP